MTEDDCKKFLASEVIYTLYCTVLHCTVLYCTVLYNVIRYGAHQMALIRKRLKVEMWMYEHLQKLFLSEVVSNLVLEKVPS